MAMIGGFLTLAGCQDELSPSMSPTNGAAPGSQPVSPGNAGPNTPPQGSSPSTSADTRKADLEFAKSELQRFQNALEERRAESQTKITELEAAINTKQNEVDFFAKKGTLTAREVIAFEQAKRDKADREKELAEVKEAQKTNEGVLARLIEAKYQAIAKLEKGD